MGEDQEQHNLVIELLQHLAGMEHMAFFLFRRIFYVVITLGMYPGLGLNIARLNSHFCMKQPS